MSLRITGGQFGSRIIATPDSSKTHPMGDRIRSSLFNILGDLSGARVLDAFAGSGSMGLEALSRGATHATFIEKDRVASKIIAENAKLLGVSHRVSIINASVAGWDQTTSETNRKKFDYIFIDPPYHDLQLSTVNRLSKYVLPNGLMVLSYPGRESVPTVNGVVVVDKRSYGDAALAFYHLDTENDTVAMSSKHV